MATKKDKLRQLKLTNREVWEMYNDKRYWFSEDKSKVYKQIGDNDFELYAQRLESGWQVDWDSATADMQVDWDNATETSAVAQAIQENTLEMRKLREAIRLAENK